MIKRKKYKYKKREKKYKTIKGKLIIISVVILVGFFTSKSIHSDKVNLDKIASAFIIQNVSTTKDSIATNNTKPNTKNKTANNSDGNAWKIMSLSQKKIIVSSVVMIWKKAGSTVTVGNSWFINALNLFYDSNNTEETNVESVMATAATTSGVVN
jgi:uncharacterized membrane protein